MAKVDWITWKTDVTDIINPEKVDNDLNKNISEINSIIDSIYDNVKVEVNKGGLSNTALNLNGESPSNVMADNILKNIEEIRMISNKLKDKINNQVVEQKKIEKNQLVTSIEEKITEQEKILENTEALKGRLTEGNNVVSVAEVDNVINITKEKINMLHERLEKAKAI